MQNRNFKKLMPVYCAVIVVALASAFLLNRAATNVNQVMPVSTGMTVIIDAGHGFPDGGTTSCTGVIEADLNLEISLRLNDLFHFFGVNTVMLRTDPNSVYTEGYTIAGKKISDIRNRVSRINSMRNAVLLSIHQNHFYDSQYAGAQVFYANSTESEQLAKKLQSDLVENLNPTSNRKAKQSSGVYLMEHIKCTGVLIECGFLSNIQEESLLRSADYQKKLCAVIVTSCNAYMNQSTTS